MRAEAIALKGSQTLRTSWRRAMMHVIDQESSACRADAGSLPWSFDTRNIHRYTDVIAESPALGVDHVPDNGLTTT